MDMRRVAPGLYERTDTPTRVSLSEPFIAAVRAEGNTLLTAILEAEMDDPPVNQRCVCGHWRGIHFRLPSGSGQRGGCMRPSEKSPPCPCRGFEPETVTA